MGRYLIRLRIQMPIASFSLIPDNCRFIGSECNLPLNALMQTFFAVIIQCRLTESRQQFAAFLLRQNRQRTHEAFRRRDNGLKQYAETLNPALDCSAFKKIAIVLPTSGQPLFALAHGQRKIKLRCSFFHGNRFQLKLAQLHLCSWFCQGKTHKVRRLISVRLLKDKHGLEDWRGAEVARNPESFHHQREWIKLMGKSAHHCFAELCHKLAEHWTIRKISA